MSEITASISVDYDRDGKRLREYGETFGRTLTHGHERVSCYGALSQDHADAWCVNRAKETYGWTFRTKWWQFWKPEPPK